MRRFLSCVMLALVGLIAIPAAAASFPADSRCHRLAPEGGDVAALARDAAGWNCQPRDWVIDGRRQSLVRIAIPAGSEEPTAVLTTRLTRFRHLSITAIGAHGAVATRTITPEDLTFSTTQWKMRMPLPHLAGGAPTQAYVLAVSGARHAAMLSDAIIAPPPDEARVSDQQLILAALCGLMAMPLVLNFAFFRILRQRFILWHSANVAAMLVQTLVSSGIINRFAHLTLDQLCLASSLSWAGIIVATVRFFIGLIEPEMLTRRQRLLLEALIPWFLFWSAYYLFADGVFLSSVAPLYYLAFLPVIVLVVFAVASAAMRGSRTAWFQIVAWLPLTALGLSRIASILGLTDAPLSLMLEQNLAIAFEVIVTSLGAADRLLTIRLQRDDALAKARLHASLAQRDPLTGLLNRRTLEDEFDTLYESGFRTMAILDLDHFKRVNDTHGHAAGDAVLKAVADALMPDDDTIAVRMGGEEFLLLLRGPDTVERAERRRQAIPSRVAKRYPGLHRLVTASMGIISEASANHIGHDFASLYAACDRLLYKSKADGRDCFSGDSATALAPIALPMVSQAG
ncbi:GGDEF domain-containing protein [Novosphingobium sp. 1949]|uniref:diguanylate cyclase n=1 Tax=Novosphingobium organovorum TaxID=2930092 RepID=A0ABT0BH75_9SPHN|nr:diguanylate cyclase [Novosphingobium organovorum]MCJ2184141.1 GGDEF domain-containing protein [Novosphingobium organovorum]